MLSFYVEAKMKKRFSEEQIIGILREGEVDGYHPRHLPQAQHYRADVFPLAIQVWRHDGIGCA
jgi:hypothetical protein